MNLSYLLILLLNAFSFQASSEKLGWTPWQGPEFYNDVAQVNKDLAAQEALRKSEEELRKSLEEKEIRKKEKKKNV